MTSRPTIRWYICYALMFQMAACSQPVTAESTNELPAVVGWGPLKFGMNMDEAVSALPNISWNSWSVSECAKKVAVAGCLLISDDDNSDLAPIDGIQFKPNLSFDKYGQLSQIHLGFSRDEDFRKAECLAVFGRAFDGVKRRYGSLTGPNYKRAESDVKAGWVGTTIKTNEGNQYSIGQKGKTDVYVTETLMTHRPTNLPNQRSAAIDEWRKGSHVSLLSSLIDMDGSWHCSVDVTYARGSEVSNPNQANGNSW